MANVPLTPAELISSLELSGKKDLDDQIKNWIMWDKNLATLKQVVDAVKAKDWQALRTRLCRNIFFGTMGLRSGMRAGFDSINDLVTIQFAQGLSHYLQEVYPNVVLRESQGVVIGYDGRYNGKRFAQLLAAVFLNSNFRVYLFNRMTPTPIVCFAVVHLNCLAGIAVTGSHSPKSENGYKVFWSNGAPIMMPHDKNVVAAMLDHMAPLPSSWDLSILDDHALLSDPFREVYPAYYEALKSLIPYSYMETNECSQLRFVYTALHGVGFQYVREAFYQARLKPLIPVVRQKDPDPDFPTVYFPNPAEGKGTLSLAFKTAEEEHCTIILANDADADRLVVAELDPKGRWKVFDGNELGALLGWWALESYKTNSDRPDVSNCVMLSTIISSKILGAMARAEGFIFVETGVGYKWLANKALEIQKLDRTILFGFEQPEGYMFSLNVPDKDGINAACQVATMASHLRSTRRVTLIEKLREIYDTYGYHANISRWFEFTDVAKVIKMFEKLRNYEDNLPGTYPKCILGGEFEVKYVRDLTTGVDTSYPDGKARLPVSATRQFITFTFNNGMWISWRTSGMEPRVRYYAELFGLPEEKDWEEISDKLHRMTNAFIDEIIRPADYGMTSGD